MSTHGIQWYGWGENGSGKCASPASLDALANDFKADHLRISMYIQEGGYETDPAGFTAQVDKIIDEVIKRGMYAIVDWHQLNPGDRHYNLDRAKSYFAHIAQKYGNQKNILYDIANEPNSAGGPVTWAMVRQ